MSRSWEPVIYTLKEQKKILSKNKTSSCVYFPFWVLIVATFSPSPFWLILSFWYLEKGLFSIVPVMVPSPLFMLWLWLASPLDLILLTLCKPSTSKCPYYSAVGPSSWKSQQNFYEKGPSSAIFLDVAKAFDRIWVEDLLYKLTILNLSSFLVKTISSSPPPDVSNAFHISIIHIMS